MPIKYPRNGSILSFATLRKTMGGKSDLFEFLSLYASRDIMLHDLEFTEPGGLINGEYFILEDSGGTSGENFAVQTALGGYIQADSGTADNGSIGLFGPIIYNGDQNAGFELRIRSDVVTGYNLEVGYTDAIEGSNESAVSDIDTPAAAATDLAVAQIDTDQTLQTLAFCTDGGTASQDVAATTFPTTTVLTAATWATFRIQLVGNFAAVWLNGLLEADHNVANTQSQGALEGGTLLMPFVYIRTRDTTAKFVDVQYLVAWMDRED